jgi:hypothetical protein
MTLLNLNGGFRDYFASISHYDSLYIEVRHV